MKPTNLADRLPNIPELEKGLGGVGFRSRGFLSVVERAEVEHTTPVESRAKTLLYVAGVNPEAGLVGYHTSRKYGSIIGEPVYTIPLENIHNYTILISFSD